MPQMLFLSVRHGDLVFFSSSLPRNAATFTANEGVFGKVYFPRLTIPISHVFSLAVEFGIQFLMIAAFLLYYVITGRVSPNWWAVLLIPAVLLHIGLLGLGFGIIISSMTTKYRDLSILVGFGVSLWMYAAPVVYPLSAVKAGWIKSALLANPVTMPVEFYGYALLGKGTVQPLHLAVSWAVTVAVALLGTVIFNKVQRNFIDMV